jgi:hypothetical protein
LPNSISSENNPCVIPFSSSSLSSSSSSSLSNTFSNYLNSSCNIDPTNNKWLILDKYHQNSEKGWSKNRELFEKRFVEEFGSLEACLLLNSINWFQFKSISHINIQLEWWPEKPTIIDQHFKFTIVRKACLLHGSMDFNFKLKHDFPSTTAFHSKEGNIFWKSLFSHFSSEFDVLSRIKKTNVFSVCPHSHYGRI